MTEASKGTVLLRQSGRQIVVEPLNVAAAMRLETLMNSSDVMLRTVGMSRDDVLSREQATLGALSLVSTKGEDSRFSKIKRETEAELENAKTIEDSPPT